MPIEVAVWRIGARPAPMPITGIDTERRLEDMLAHDVTILDRNLMLIGRQVLTAFGKLIDLLAIDSQGDLTIVEIKRDRTPREVNHTINEGASSAIAEPFAWPTHFPAFNFVPAVGSAS